MGSQLLGFRDGPRGIVRKVYSEITVEAMVRQCSVDSSGTACCRAGPLCFLCTHLEYSKVGSLLLRTATHRNQVASCTRVGRRDTAEGADNLDKRCAASHAAADCAPRARS